MGSQLAFDRPGNDLWRLIAERPDRGCLRDDLDQAAPRKCHHEVVELLEAPAGLADVGAGAVTERLRDIEDLLAERGIDVSFLTISEWGAKFGCKCAHQPRRMSRGYSADKWHLDEMIVSIKGGRKYWLWRAVDANGCVLDALLQSGRPKGAALRLKVKLLGDQSVTLRVIVADKLRSYDGAKREERRVSFA